MRKTPTEEVLRLAIAGELVKFLNELLELDRQGISALLMLRVLVNRKIGDHPTVQVLRQGANGVHLDQLGALGLLNGLCGVDAKGNGFLQVVCDDGATDDAPGLVQRVQISKACEARMQRLIDEEKANHGQPQ